MRFSSASDSPIRVPPEKSVTAAVGPLQRAVVIAAGELEGDPRQPRAEGERLDPAPRRHRGLHVLQQHPRVGRHRARHVADEHDLPRPGAGSRASAGGRARRRCAARRGRSGADRACARGAATGACAASGAGDGAGPGARSARARRPSPPPCSARNPSRAAARPRCRPRARARRSGSAAAPPASGIPRLGSAARSIAPELGQRRVGSGRPPVAEHGDEGGVEAGKAGVIGAQHGPQGQPGVGP